MSHSQDWFFHLRTFGNPMGYYPRLAKPLGSVNAVILFSHLLYWSDKTSNPLGVYKTAAEIEWETGLSSQEQRTARKKLRDLGILIETEKRIEHRIYFKLDADAFAAVMNAFVTEYPDGWNVSHPQVISPNARTQDSTFPNSNINNPEMQNQQSGIPDSTFDGLQNQHSYNEQKTTNKLQQKTTTGGERASEKPAAKISRGSVAAAAASPAPSSSSSAETSSPAKPKRQSKTQKPRFSPLQALLDRGVSEQVAQDYLDFRGKKRLTQTALDGLIREAEKAGLSLVEVLQICIERGWIGFKASWESWKDLPTTGGVRAANAPFRPSGDYSQGCSSLDDPAPWEIEEGAK